jgi:mannosyltransferase OCH1-like enzyme
MYNSFYLHILIIFLIIIIFYFINIILRKKQLESFDIYLNKETPIQYKPELKDTPLIWQYWETLPGKTKPGYIDLCMNSVIKNCDKCFKIIHLDNTNIYDYLPEIKDIDFSNLELPQKVDYYRYALLEKYGGVWLDADILVLKCICPFYEKLNKENDYVGFGCGFDTPTCSKTLYGYSRPLNWFMISRANTPFIKCVKNSALEKILESNDNNQKLPYHSIGKELLNKCYKKLNDEKDWNYTHIPSKCQEYDTKGNKLNNIMIDFNWQDCKDERIFFPLYNTAPGYPDWFKNLSEEELKNNDTYLKPIIDMAFDDNNICKKNN